MNISEMRQAVDNAKSVQARADHFSTDIAGLLVGRLKHVNRHDYLAQLKKELSKYNTRTGQWKD